MIPEGQPKYNDLIDIIITGAKEPKEIEQQDGTVLTELQLNQEIIWWKTGSVNSETFARLAFELKEWERMAVECFNYMTPERAKQYANQIIDIATSIRRSIDAKSSESRRDKNNSQSTLIDKINRNKIEKVYTQKGEIKKSLFDSFVGRDKERDEERDE